VIIGLSTFDTCTGVGTAAAVGAGRRLKVPVSTPMLRALWGDEGAMQSSDRLSLSNCDERPVSTGIIWNWLA